MVCHKRAYTSLSTMHSRHRIAFLTEVGVLANFWIGLSDEANNGEYMWAESGATVTYQHWHQGQPLSGATSVNCVTMYSFWMVRLSLLYDSRRFV